jgi:hypothetical protein
MASMAQRSRSAPAFRETPAGTAPRAAVGHRTLACGCAFGMRRRASAAQARWALMISRGSHPYTARSDLARPDSAFPRATPRRSRASIAGTIVPPLPATVVEAAPARAPRLSVNVEAEEEGPGSSGAAAPTESTIATERRPRTPLGGKPALAGAIPDHRRLTRGPQACWRCTRLRPWR